MTTPLVSPLSAQSSGGRAATSSAFGWFRRFAGLLLLVALWPAGVSAQVSLLGTPASVTEKLGSQFSKTMLFTAPAGNNRLLVVTTGGGGNGVATPTVTFNGTAMTQGAVFTTGPVRTGIWYLALGTSSTGTTGNVVVTYNSNFFFDVVALTLQGVDQATPVSGPQTSGAASLAVTSATGDLVVDAIAGSGASVAVAGGQTLVANNNDLVFNGDPDTGASTKPGAASVTMNWTGYTAGIVHAALNVRQVPAVPVSITTNSLIGAAVGSNYLDIVSATGGSGSKTFAVTVGALPPGLVLSSSGTVSGSPTTPGTYNFTVTATDAANATGTKAFSIVIIGPPTVTTPTSASITATTVTLGGNLTTENGATTQSRGVVYALTATNANLQFGGTGVTSATTSGSGTGVFSVNVTGLTAGAAYSFKAYATNATGIGYTAVGTFTTTAAIPITISPTALPGGTVGAALSQAITASGGTGAITFAATTLPAGLTLTSGGFFSGTPTTAGTFNFTVTATDTAAATATRAYSFVVGAAAPLAITAAALPNAVVGTAGYSQAIVATGGTGTVTFNTTGGALPPGLSITLGGLIVGTATTAGTYNFTVSAIDSIATIASRAFSIVVTAPSALVIATTTLTSAIVNVPGYSQTIAVTGATGTTTFAVTSGTLPTGLTLSSTGTISGTPTTAALYNFTVTATDSTATTVSKAFSIAIGATAPLAFTTTTLPNAPLNTAGYSTTLVITGGTGTTTFGITGGALPPGLAITLAGTISGTATTAGTYSFTASAVDTAASTTSRTFTIIVAAVGQTPQTITFAALPNMAVGDAPVTLTATASSGLPVTFTASGPVTISGSTLTLTGQAGPVLVTASQAGNATFAAAPNIAQSFSVVALGDRIINLSSRVRIAPDSTRQLIAGFVIGGTQSKRVVVRAIGPALTGFGVEGAVANPKLQIFNAAGAVILENDDWSGADTAAAFTAVSAFSLPVGSKDAALVTTLAPGAYTMQVTAGNETGIALAEVYDASPNPGAETQRLVNIATRGMVEAGDGVLIGGFVIKGTNPKKILIRGVGPQLGAFGVTGTLADPRLTVSSGQTTIAQNDNWSIPVTVVGGQAPATATEIAAAAKAVGAFDLTAGSADAAVLLTLPPGVYTAQIAGNGTTTGVALVEIYEVP